MTRTNQQNRALHRWLRLVAQELADQHFDFREIKIELRPTEELVKTYMWKPVQEALYGTKSTTELERNEVADVYDHLNRLLGERFGIHVPFPERDSNE